ncbi:hypothetical protein [Parvibaculum sp.]|nr:hypothetical protein [Parvibaculum sp.]|tara:strand:+ start:318 stop:467 length:150 start_codon:yes stop_codon:yes gene_type:complete
MNTSFAKGLNMQTGHETNGWLKDIAALASITAFIFTAVTWVEIARGLMG